MDWQNTEKGFQEGQSEILSVLLIVRTSLTKKIRSARDACRQQLDSSSDQPEVIFQQFFKSQGGGGD